MNVFFRDFFTDPVLFLSFGILGIVIALCIYYVYYFVKKVNEAEIPE
ncbi:hypothetical protein [Pseudoalteromonas luteoviolacea]|uniref:DUF3149 domain-containing protein n=2 Tax=Pseudoalteromonas luteoviolacea TaxID=43657 RepID=A0A166YUI0_9GAMM|nr:hypothetical protein [Pseudoalteromonas luteoviolacea]KZN37167.1 hypothetical protein N480_15355 [Pseudoalteromonas luteoviolacea S2607]KZN43536.1 hypothetical protein N475_09025 [Pseudoalteromonas luteoviolacea DSM 6061]KZN57376.1 hypothetical protein N474_08170 [Pseudoalteromonas luteoviolacea CPMOR-2]KZN64626.1 hypothetical protein N478_21770 [Pseudoalteromonas luteoviolacea S4060-1]MBE0388031.1 hypothetical protein [Pseudoalteromonas luteoviolacea DSM 6061]